MGQPLRQFNAVHFRHHQIKDNDAGLKLFIDFRKFISPLGGANLEPQALGNSTNDLGNRGIVIYNK